jgi:phosphoglycerol transferase
MDSFLAGADCMGDLLSQDGYHLVFMGGASLEFAGKGKFFRTHGFDEVLGRNELVPLLPDQSYQSNWGLYDDSLFNMAFQKIEELSSAEQPFGLFLLTLDTHGSDNHFSRSCQGMTYADGKNRMLNAVACSDYLINNFIQRVRKSPNYKNTVIVLVSDHFAMGNSAYGMLKKSGKRSNLFLIFDPEAESGYISAKRGSILDVGATVLSVLGFKSALGLGRNLFVDEPSSLGKEEHIYSRVQGWRKDIMKFWSFPEITRSVTINGQQKTIKIDDRTFGTPVLVQYDDQLQAKMWFKLYNSPNHKTLLENLMTFPPETSFLLVNACNSIPEEWTGTQGEGLCLVRGKLGSGKIRSEHIADTLLLTAEQL